MRIFYMAAAGLAVLAGVLGAPALAGQAEAGAPKPAAAAPPAPPPPIPEVTIPPIPPVGDEPFKAGPVPKPAPDEPRTVEESKRVFNRSGRLVTDQAGHTVFAFDSGAPPMRLLENSLREYLEDATKGGKLLAKWRVSGLVTEYRKHNYLLLSKVVRVMPEEGGL